MYIIKHEWQWAMDSALWTGRVTNCKQRVFYDPIYGWTHACAKPHTAISKGA